MAAVLTGGTSFDEIGPTGTIDYPSAEWSVFLMFNPAVAASRNSQDYMYGHGQPSASLAAVNISLVGIGGSGTVNEVRCRVESTVSVKLLDNTSNTAVENSWNAFLLVWDGSNFHLYLNGVQTTYGPAATVTSLTPSAVVKLGQRDDESATRAYTGSICHVAQWHRDIQADIALRATAILLSPQFAQQDLQFHVEVWNGSFNYDLQSVQTVTARNGLTFGPHAPASYPSDPHEFPHVPEPPVQNQAEMAQDTFA